jgi:hypothetical protein
MGGKSDAPTSGWLVNFLLALASAGIIGLVGLSFYLQGVVGGLDERTKGLDERMKGLKENVASLTLKIDTNVNTRLIELEKLVSTIQGALNPPFRRPR